MEAVKRQIGAMDKETEELNNTIAKLKQVRSTAHSYNSTLDSSGLYECTCCDSNSTSRDLEYAPYEVFNSLRVEVYCEDYY